jgi:hypothetical protein
MKTASDRIVVMVAITDGRAGRISGNRELTEMIIDSYRCSSLFTSSNQSLPETLHLVLLPLPANAYAALTPSKGRCLVLGTTTLVLRVSYPLYDSSTR